MNTAAFSVTSRQQEIAVLNDVKESIAQARAILSLVAKQNEDPTTALQAASAIIGRAIGVIAFEHCDLLDDDMVSIAGDQLRKAQSIIYLVISDGGTDAGACAPICNAAYDLLEQAMEFINDICP